LDAIVNNASQRLVEIKREFAELAITNGWPDSFDDRAATASATAHGLLVCSDILNRDDDSLFKGRSEDFLLDQVTIHKGGQFLDTMAWISLARVATKYAGVLSEAQAHNLFDKIETLREGRRRNQVTETSLRFIPKLARKSALFVLSEGRPEAIPYWNARSIIGSMPTSIKWATAAIGAGIAAAFYERIVDALKKAVLYIVSLT